VVVPPPPPPPPPPLLPGDTGGVVVKLSKNDCDLDLRQSLLLRNAIHLNKENQPEGEEENLTFALSRARQEIS